MTVYSYHTFMLPFVIQQADECVVQQADKWDVQKFPVAGSGWKKCTLGEIAADRKEPDNDLAACHATYQYMTPEARELFWGEDACLLDYDLTETDRTYQIKHGDDTFALSVDAVRLLLLDNRVGVFILETSNYEARTLDAVRKINEYGRRINLPYYGKFPHALVADQLMLLGKKVEFEKWQNKLLQMVPEEAINVRKNIAPLFYDLIAKAVGSDSTITPVIDDRMFVQCMVCDSAYSGRLKNEIDVFSDEEFYATVFVDASGDSASCQSEGMRREILTRCVYDRWRDYATVDAVTHHSIFRMTSTVGAPGLWASVQRPFLTQYMYLAIGALLGRATILELSKRSAKISVKLNNDLSRKHRGVGYAVREEIEKLNSDFVKARNNIFLNQLTQQEQGIEEFDLLRQELYIDESLAELDDKVGKLYELSSIYVEHSENRMLNAITVLGLPLAIGTFVIDLFSRVCDTDIWVLAVGVAAALVSSGVIGSIWQVGKRKQRKYLFPGGNYAADRNVSRG